jgi:hypothetical protein
MAKTSSATAAKVVDFGLAEDRSTDLDGYTVNFVTIKVAHDLAGPLAALPGGHCPCPHWGYVLKGRIVVRYADGTEDVIEAGDAFSMRPGHVPAADAGTEFVMFSPAAELAVVEQAIAAAMQGG